MSAAAVAIAAAGVAGKMGGAFEFAAYPSFSAPVAPAEAALAVALPLAAVAPLLGAAARLGVARA